MWKENCVNPYRSLFGIGVSVLNVEGDSQKISFASLENFVLIAGCVLAKRGWVSSLKKMTELTYKESL